MACFQQGQSPCLPFLRDRLTDKEQGRFEQLIRLLCERLLCKQLNRVHASGVAHVIREVYPEANQECVDKAVAALQKVIQDSLPLLLECKFQEFANAVIGALPDVLLGLLRCLVGIERANELAADLGVAAIKANARLVVAEQQDVCRDLLDRICPGDGGDPPPPPPPPPAGDFKRATTPRC